MIVVSVPTFDDQIDASGNLVTYYVINVEDTKTSYKYKLTKRYSAFANLWETLKDRFSGLKSFNFPDKSMFNTHDSYTKMRRRQGFEAFLKILTTINPIPTEFEDFLELDDHMSRLQKLSDELTRDQKNEADLTVNRNVLQLEKAILETAVADYVSKCEKLSSQVENLQIVVNTVHCTVLLIPLCDIYVAEFERCDFQVYKNEAESKESQYKSRIAQLENDKRSLENSVTAHVNSINYYKEYKEYSNVLNQQIQRLETDKKRLESSVSEHVKTINQYSEKSKSLNQTIQELERYKSVLAQNETQYIAKITQLGKDKRGLKSTVSEHVKAIDQYRNNEITQSDNLERYKSVLTQSKAKIAQLEKDKKGLENSVTEHVKIINQHIEELTSLQQVINQLDEDKEILMNQNRRNGDLTRKYNAQTVKITQLERTVASSQAEIDRMKSTIDENGDDDENRCVICMEADKTILTLPCKHMCTCEECYSRLPSEPRRPKQCPICRTDVKKRFKVFI